MNLDQIETAASRHAGDINWPGAAIAYEAHVTPAVVVELCALIRKQEAALQAIPAQTGMPAVTVDTPEFDNLMGDYLGATDGNATAYAAVVAHIDAHTAAVAAKAAAGSNNAFKEAYMEWSRKTDWVQEQISTFPVNALGMHRADVMREEIERLRAAAPQQHAQASMSEEAIDAVIAAMGWSLDDVERKEVGQFAHAIVKASQQPAAAPGAPDEPWKWTPGPDEFKGWCTQYFGPDADEVYLAQAVFHLPAMAQKFKWRAAAAPAIQQEGAALDEPVAYADPQAFKNFDRVRAGEVMPAAASHEWMWARPSAGLVPMYLGQPVADAAPVEAKPETRFTVDELWSIYGVLRVAGMTTFAHRVSDIITAAQPSPAQGDAPHGDWPEDYRDVLKNSETVAHQQGRAAGIEEAAKAAESVGRPVGASDGCTYIPGTSADAARAIRALAAKPSEGV